MLRSSQLSARESQLLNEAFDEIEQLVAQLDDRQDALKDLLTQADSLDGGDDASKSAKKLARIDDEAAELARAHANSATTIIDTAEKVGWIDFFICILSSTRMEGNW